jgi:hypothetical protein
MIPYFKKEERRFISILFGGAYNTLRQCFFFDDVKREVSRCSVYAGDVDRILTN